MEGEHLSRDSQQEGQPDQYTERYNISLFSCLGEEDIKEKQETELPPSPQHPQFGAIIDTAGLDQHQTNLLNSILRKLRSCPHQQESYREELNQLEKGLLPQLLGRVRSKDDQQVIKLHLQKIQKIDDPGQLTAKVELEIWKSKFIEKNETVQELRELNSELISQVQQLTRSLQTIKAQLKVRTGFEGVRVDLLETMRVRSEEWEIEKEGLEKYYNEQIQKAREMCENMKCRYDGQLEKMKTEKIDLEGINNRLQYEATALQLKNREIMELLQRTKEDLLDSKSRIENKVSQFDKFQSTLLEKEVAFASELESIRCDNRDKELVWARKAQGLQSEIKELKASHEQWLIQAKQVQDGLKVQRQAAGKLKILIDQLRGEVKAKSKELERKEKVLSQMTVFQSQLVQQCKLDLKTKVDQCQQQVILRSKYEAEAQRLKTKSRQLASQKDSLKLSYQSKLFEREEKIDKLYNQFQRLTFQVKVFEQQKNEMRKQVETFKEKVKVMEDENQQNEQQKINKIVYQQEFQSLKKSSKQLEDKLYQHSRHNSNMKEEILQKEQELQRHLEIIKELQSEVASLHIESGSLSMLNSTLKKAQSESDLTVVHSHLEDFFKGLRNFKKKLDKSQLLNFRQKVAFLLS